MSLRKFSSIMEEMRFMYTQNYYPLIKAKVKRSTYWNRYNILRRSIQENQGILIYLFDWGDTPQGHKYWEAIYFSHYKDRYF